MKEKKFLSLFTPLNITSYFSSATNLDHQT